MDYLNQAKEWLEDLHQNPQIQTDAIGAILAFTLIAIAERLDNLLLEDEAKMLKFPEKLAGIVQTNIFLITNLDRRITDLERKLGEAGISDE